MKNPFALFRKIAMLEGISFLILLCIAMPLKYFANMPMPVRIIGGLHGALFVAFIILSLMVAFSTKKNLFWLCKAALASFIPFGTFYMNKEWEKEEKQDTILTEHK